MTLMKTRRALRRGGAVITGGAMVAAVAMMAGPTAASADSTLSITYPVTGSTYVQAPGATLPLGPGKLAATVDLDTGALSANLTMPDATGSFKEFGIIPVTATAQFIDDGPATGMVNLDTGATQATANITLRLVSLQVAGINVPVGPACQTAQPVSVSLASQPGFNVLKGGDLAGSYTLPAFANCGLATLLIDVTLPGPNNTISLTLGKGKTS
ncbi:MAG TPA: hypothetical protein VGH27_31725 [Streptosporangiaceae bacterium]|jgi:hypothetical protein